MTLIPAVMALLGERAWWLPRWLDRLLPRVDVEGEQLRKRFAEVQPADDALLIAAGKTAIKRHGAVSGRGGR